MSFPNNGEIALGQVTIQINNNKKEDNDDNDTSRRISDKNSKEKIRTKGT